MPKFLQKISGGLGLLLAGGVAQAQAPAWQQLVSVAGSVSATVADADGNLYLAGRFTGSASFGNTQLVSAGGSDAFVAKWSPTTKAFVWAQRAGGGGDDYADVLAISGSNLYVAGSYVGTATFGASTLTSAGGDDGYVLKLTDAGSSASLGWVQGLSGPDADRITGLAAVGASVYVAGIFASTQATLGTQTLTNSASGSATNDGLVARLADAGAASTVAWVQRIGSPNSDLLTGLAAAGNAVYVAGLLGGPVTLGSSVVNSCFYARLTDTGSAGNYAWAINSGGLTLPNALAASGGNLYAVGRFLGTGTWGSYTYSNTGAGGSYDLFTAKIADAGTSASFAWVLPGFGPLTDFANALAVRGNKVYVVGGFSSTATFGSFSLTSVAASNDWVVAGIRDNGSTAAYAWVQQAGSSAYEQATAVAVGSAGTVYVVGGVGTGATFGSLTAGGGTTLAWLTDPALLTTRPALPNAALLYPNPAHGTATVRVPAGAGPATVQVLDALGRPVRTATAPAGQDYALDLAGLPAGVYAAQVQVDGATAVQRLAVE